LLTTQIFGDLGHGFDAALGQRPVVVVKGGIGPARFGVAEEGESQHEDDNDAILATVKGDESPADREIV
jgi:hypothetical protein